MLLIDASGVEIKRSPIAALQLAVESVKGRNATHR